MHKIIILGSMLLCVFNLSCKNRGNTAGTANSAETVNSQKSEKQNGSKNGKKMSKEIKNILFFGNSITAGYGLEDPSEAFPAIITLKIDSLKLPYRVVNGGLSGETTAGGKSRIGWLLKNQIDVFVLELGANDGLRGIPVSESRKNLQSIIDQVRLKYPTAKMVMTGMLVPPSMGKTYGDQFKKIFSEIAKKNKMALVPFLLEGVAGKPSLNQADGIHPTAIGAKIVASNVWKVLEPLL